MTTAKVSTALAAARADDSARRHDRVLRALDALTTAGPEITVSAVARAARVHRSFIHRHPQLHAAVTAAQGQPVTVAMDSAISTASLHADLANMHAQNTRLARHITLLENDYPKHSVSKSSGRADWAQSMKPATYVAI